MMIEERLRHAIALGHVLAPVTVNLGNGRDPRSQPFAVLRKETENVGPNGPRAGNPTPMNVVLLSPDPVALDAVACRLIDLDPCFVPTARPGREAGLGTWREEEIELLGDPIQPLINRSFDVIRRDVEAVAMDGRVPFVKNLVSSRPVIRDDRCAQCGICVQTCPVTPKALDWSGAEGDSIPSYRYRRCIRCFCCQELCPEQAIEVTRPVLGRLFFGRR